MFVGEMDIVDNVVVDDVVDDKIAGIDLADLIAASSDVVSVKDGDNAVTQILEELTEQLDVLEDLMDVTNYGADDMGSIEVPGNDLEDGHTRRSAILTAVTVAVGRGGVTIMNDDLVEGTVTDLRINETDYVEDTLRDWDTMLLESLGKVVEAFSSQANLDAALDDGIFGDVADADSSFKGEDPALATGDVFGVVPSEVNAVFDYTEYTRFGLWTSETIASANPATDPPDVGEEQTDDASATATGRYAYSPLGNTGLGRADLPSVKGSYEGYTYAYGADLTIYGGDLEITIDWKMVGDTTADDTGIEVMISDLIDSDGMG